MPRDTLEAINYIFKQAVLLTDKKINRSSAIVRITETHGTNKGSCEIYLNNIRQLLTGLPYKREMSVNATEILLQNIHTQYGIAGLKAALKALNGHIEYRESQKSTEMKSLRKTFVKWSAKATPQILFAYHRTHKLGPFNKEWYRTSKKTPNISDTVYVLSGDMEKKETKYYLEGKFEIIKIDEIISESDNRRKLYLAHKQVPASPVALDSVNVFDKKDFHNKFTSGQNFNQIKEPYLSLFSKLLQQVEQTDEIYSDIENIRNDGKLSDTEKESLVKSRIGQGEFRQNVIQLWGLGEVCPVTKISIKEMLIASHIKPWRQCSSKKQRLDGANGILLCSHLDKLFDNHLISFEISGGNFVCRISSDINADELANVGISNGIALDTSNINHNELDRLKKYLHNHYEIFKRKQNIDNGR